jgi:hypothetical protein
MRSLGLIARKGGQISRGLFGGEDVSGPKGPSEEALAFVECPG